VSDVLAVVCTSALELGVDIGSIDCSVILGFPGSCHALWQQWGRAGRTRRDALSILVLREDDPIDSWFGDKPDRIYSLGIEDATLHWENPGILKAHMLCADFEGVQLPNLNREEVDKQKEIEWFQPSTSEDEDGDELSSGSVLSVYKGSCSAAPLMKTRPHQKVSSSGTCKQQRQF
jgi:ATP-dependent helicase YprA (DUF1998 family)